MAGTTVAEFFDSKPAGLFVRPSHLAASSKINQSIKFFVALLRHRTPT